MQRYGCNETRRSGDVSSITQQVIVSWLVLSACPAAWRATEGVAKALGCMIQVYEMQLSTVYATLLLFNDQYRR